MNPSFVTEGHEELLGQVQFCKGLAAFLGFIQL